MWSLQWCHCHCSNAMLSLTCCNCHVAIAMLPRVMLPLPCVHCHVVIAMLHLSYCPCHVFIAIMSLLCRHGAVAMLKCWNVAMFACCHVPCCCCHDAVAIVMLSLTLLLSLSFLLPFRLTLSLQLQLSLSLPCCNSHKHGNGIMTIGTGNMAMETSHSKYCNGNMRMATWQLHHGKCNMAVAPLGESNNPTEHRLGSRLESQERDAVEVNWLIHCSFLYIDLFKLWGLRTCFRDLGF